MTAKVEKAFETLVVRYDGGSTRSSVFSVYDTPGNWIDPDYDTITWHEFLVYGIPDAPNALSDISKDALDSVPASTLDAVLEGDYSSTIQIGRILGCHIPVTLIENLGADPYAVCDENNADLEALYSVLQECKEHEDFEDWIDEIYYIHEIELEPEYQSMGYEAILLLQLPAIVVKALRVFPSLIMYYPRPLQHDEPERDPDAEAILVHRLEYITRKATKGNSDENIVYFPPRRPVPEHEINRVLGRRNPGETVPKAYRNKKLYKQYKEAGFKEAGQTGWLYKRIYNIYTKDGLNH